MKTVITLILALFMFSFTLESSTNELPKQGDKILIMHYTENGFIEIEISIDALESHLNHGDHVSCLPPCRP